MTTMYQCPICTRKFRSRETLCHHLDRFHKFLNWMAGEWASKAVEVRT